MKLSACLLIALCWSAAAASQNCTCAQKLKKIQHEMETNYAGFKDKVNAKTKATYERQTKKYTALAAKNPKEAYCMLYIKEWLEFFKDGHVQLGGGKNNKQNDTALLNARIKSTELVYISPENLKKLSQTQVREEGIYYSPDSTYKIAIMRSKNEFRDFVGVIVASKTPLWQPGQVKLEMKKENDTIYKTILYYRDHSPRVHQYYFNGTSYDGGNWNKENTKPAAEEPEAQPSGFGFQPIQVQQLSDSTIYIQIGTFDISNATTIDSIFTAYEQVIKKTPNMILDLRHNGGGSDASYQPIIPYIYTKPIIGVGNEVWATKDNIDRWLVYLDNPYMSDETKTNIKEMTDGMAKNLGKFAPHAENDTLINDKVEPFPRKVVILMNQNCASSTEELLLAARQSDKVTLMGQHSYGELDYSNLVEADLACDGIGLYYPTTRTFRIKMGQAIDGIGVLPNIPLADNKDWIKEAQTFLEKKK